MKIKKVVALCLRTKRMELLNEENTLGTARQWLGNGAAIYLLEGMPFLTEATVMRTFDIGPKEHSKLMFNNTTLPEGIDTTDYDGEDMMAHPMSLNIASDGRVLCPFKTAVGEIFLFDQKYLAPFGEDVGYSVRSTIDGAPYLAVMEGMFLVAIIFPVKISSATFEDLRTVANKISALIGG